MKRAFDVVVSTALLAVCSPVFALISLWVLIESGRPLIFKQVRVGLSGRPFWLWKFRSMRADVGGASITVRGDRRITRVGRILRKAKLDELPQFWNVLRGDMSLVGPRPEVPEYVERFKERYLRILTVRPGITDLASIRYRNEESVLAGSSEPQRTYEETVLPAKLDLADEYLGNMSVRRDLWILLQTAFVTLWKSE
jgi:lipopolysaccharide/colanic/teichoic acid biosynthesis glycosyltransferase